MNMRTTRGLIESLSSAQLREITANPGPPVEIGIATNTAKRSPVVNSTPDAEAVVNEYDHASVDLPRPNVSKQPF